MQVATYGMQSKKMQHIRKNEINRKRHRSGTDKKIRRKGNRTTTIGTLHMFKKIDKNISA